MIIWKTIPKYKDLYIVSNMGQVQRILNRYGNPSQRILRQTPDGNNYLQVTLCKNGIRKKHKVHKLVLISFIGPRPLGLQCRHLDGNKQNNKLTNLKWGTRSENEKDKIKHGTFNHRSPLGSKHGMSKLTKKDVIKIKIMLNSCENQHVIADIFGVHHSNISCIKRGITWRHINVESPPKENNNRN